MDSFLHYRIAIWNLECPKQNGWVKNQRRLNKIYEINADVGGSMSPLLVEK